MNNDTHDRNFGCRDSSEGRLILPGGGSPFLGSDAVRRLSGRLLLGDARSVSDSEVAEVIGQAPLKAFRYAEEQLRGRYRKTTGEPAFCHSADIAFRAVDLGYPSPTVEVSLLHDVPEDCSRTIEELVAHLREIERLFGGGVAQDVRLVTNRYAAILEQAGTSPEVMVQAPGRAWRDAVAALRSRVPLEVAAAFEREFRQLLDYYLPGLDFDPVGTCATSGVPGTNDAVLGAYRVFIEDVADDARTRRGPPGKGFHETALVVKTLDLVDNLRTTEVSNWKVLNRILSKAEMFLDATFYLHNHIHAGGFPDATFIPAYDFLKHHMVAQVAERHRALSALSDTRFAFLVDHLVRQTRRLCEKYKVGDQPGVGLAELRDAIRAANLRSVVP